MTLNVPHFDPFSFATNLSKNSIGFDELFSKFTDMTKAAGYPPYNIKKTGDNTYVIEMAVAGFGKHNIDIEMANRSKPTNKTRCTRESADLHQGRSFVSHNYKWHHFGQTCSGEGGYKVFHV